jgi:RNA polymerase sigma factor (sigma-70 family)
MSPGGFPRLPVVQSDQRLIALAREGDERAFETIVRRYRRSLLRYCRRMGLSDSRAEDVVQQSLLRAWMALGRGGEVRAPKAWLYRTVHNTAVNAMRRARDHGPLEEGASVEVAASAESDFERRSAVRQTLSDVAALPRMQREAMLLTAIDGHSHEEIASTLGVTHGAVRGLLYRARATLRDAAAAVVPQPALLWASGLLARMSPTAGRLAELSAPAGNGDLGSALAKGAAMAATAAVLAVGTGIVSLPRHLVHPPKTAVLALSIAPATAEAQASEATAPAATAGAIGGRTPQAADGASHGRGGSELSLPSRRRAKKRADGLERGIVPLQRSPLTGSDRGSSDAGPALAGEDGQSAAANGSSPSGSGSDGTQAAKSGNTDRSHDAQAGSQCDHCSEGSPAGAADEAASHPTDAEQGPAVSTGAPTAASGEAAAERPAGN